MEAVGIMAAVGAAVLFGAGIVIQARESRNVSPEHAMRPSLLVRLANSGAWLVGTGLTLVGWGLQVLALGLAPIVVVQPLLGLTLGVVLGLGWWLVGDRVAAVDVAAIVLLAMGATALVRSAPAGGGAGTGGIRLVAPLAMLGAASLAPFLIRHVKGVAFTAMGAGTAFALCGIATKLFADALARGQLVSGVIALAVVAAAAAAGGIAEMSALQSGAVSRVVATVFALEIAVPVLLAPLLFGERWEAMGLPRAFAVAAAVAAILASTTMLARAEGVAAATPSSSSRVPTSS